jgi:hypothetical protein
MDVELIKRLSSELGIETPKVLYKYRKWDDKNHKKILMENTIYLSSPCDFEDNMDCNLSEKYPSEIELQEFFLNESKQNNPTWTRQQHRQYSRDMAKKSPLANPKRLRELVKNKNEQFNEHFGIFSATEDPNNTEMWEKYGDDFKGICIGFDSEKLFSVIGGGGSAVYLDDLPVIDFLHDDIDTKLISNILYKNSQYDYEKEYRLFRFWESGITTEGRNVSLPEECVVERILGRDISETNKAEITELVKKKYPKATIKDSAV